MDPAATALPDAASEHEDGDERRSRSGYRASRDTTQILSVSEDIGVEARGHGEKEVVGEREERGIRRVVYNFTPSWFSVTMGTGIVSILLHAMSDQPSNTTPISWLHILSLIFFVLNVFLFVVFLLLSIARYTMYPFLWNRMLADASQALFLGTFPMGFSTIVTVGVAVCGDDAVNIWWGLWWVNIVVAVVIALVLPFLVMSRHHSPLSSITAIYLLPLVSPIVGSSAGAVVASFLPNPVHALWTITTCYALWGIGVPMAFVVLVIYTHRLTVHNLPPRETIVSVFLPVGFLGQGGYVAMMLGKASMDVFPKMGTLGTASELDSSSATFQLEGDAVGVMAGEVLYVVGWLVALIMWGFGLAWLFLAVASISRSRFPFNMGWWGFTFPIGVYAMSTMTLGRKMPSLFFEVSGIVLAVAVILLWMVVTVGTIWKTSTGELFRAPHRTRMLGTEKKPKSTRESI